MILQTIWEKVVLINISPSNRFQREISYAKYHQNCQVVLASVSINGLMQAEACNWEDIIYQMK